jgi:hypothetical protein
MVSLETVTFLSIFVFCNLCYLGFIIEQVKDPSAKVMENLGIYIVLWMFVPVMTFAFGILLMSNPRYLEWFG